MDRRQFMWRRKKINQCFSGLCKNNTIQPVDLIERSSKSVATTKKPPQKVKNKKKRLKICDKNWMSVISREMNPSLARHTHTRTKKKRDREDKLKAASKTCDLESWFNFKICYTLLWYSYHSDGTQTSTFNFLLAL